MRHRTKGMQIKARMDKLQPLVFLLAKTTDLQVREIAAQVGLPYETTRRWMKRVKRPAHAMKRLPHHVIGEHKGLNLKLLVAGIPAHERVRLIEELRNAP